MFTWSRDSVVGVMNRLQTAFTSRHMSSGHGRGQLHVHDIYLNVI